MITLVIAALFLAAAACFDIKSRRIPNLLLVPLLTAGLANTLFFSSNKADNILGFFFPSLILLVFYLLGAGIGAGDIKLCACLGLFLGTFLSVFVFTLGIILSAIFALILRFCLGRKTSSLPFAPFFFAAILILIVFSLVL